MQGKIKLSMEPGDIEGFCEMAECIDFEKYFAGFDWNCFYKNMDLNPIFRNFDFEPWIEQMKTYKVGDGPLPMALEYQSDNPLLENINIKSLQDQVKVELDSLFKNTDFTKIYLNLYNNIIRKDLLTEEEEDDLEKITLLSFAVMKSVFKESRALKYYITHLWLMYETVEKVRDFQFEDALRLLKVQKNIILIANRDSLFRSDELTSEMADVGTILGPNYELKTLAGIYQQIADVNTQLGNYTAARKEFESAIQIRKSSIESLSTKNSAAIYITDNFSDDTRAKLVKKYQVTKDVIQLSSIDLMYAKHPAIIKKRLQAYSVR